MMWHEYNVQWPTYAILMTVPQGHIKAHTRCEHHTTAVTHTIPVVSSCYTTYLLRPIPLPT